MFLGLKRQKIVRMHKTCLTSQFLRLSLARFFCEGKHAAKVKRLYFSKILEFSVVAKQNNTCQML